MGSPRRTVVMPAYQAARTLQATVARLPPGLERVPWAHFNDDFGFDAQMLSALHARGLVGAEVAVGSWYQEHSSSVGLRASVRYGVQVLGSLVSHSRRER